MGKCAKSQPPRMIPKPAPPSQLQVWTKWLLSLRHEHFFNLLVLVLLQTVLMVCQFVTSSYISSIALKTNGYHTGMSSLLAGSRIMAEFARRRRPDNSFSFGYGRWPVLLEFTGIIVISILCLSAAVEAILHLNSHSSVLIDASFGDLLHYHKLEHTKTRAFAIAATSFGSAQAVLSTFIKASVNSEQFRAHSGWVQHAASNTHRRNTLYVPLLGTELTLHVSAIAWIGTVTFAIVSGFTGLWALDSLAALATVWLMVPILRDLCAKTLPVLLQMAPAGPRAAFDLAIREVRFFDGVLDCSEEHFWVSSGGSSVGSCHVKARSGVDVPDMLHRIRKRFAVAVTDMTVQITCTGAGGGDRGEGTRSSPLLSEGSSPVGGGATPTKRGGGGLRRGGGGGSGDAWRALPDEAQNISASKDT